MKPRSRRVFLYLLAPIVLALLIYLYAERTLRAALLFLSHASWARRVVTDFPPAWYVASRFVAGETIADAMRVAKELNEQGLLVTLDYLGESVTDPSEAQAARDEILSLLDAIDDTGVTAWVSVKLSQLGIKIERDLALDNMRCILQKAAEQDVFVRIDMEESALVDPTLRIFRHLRDEGYDNTGVVIQAYLYRSEADVRELIEHGASVRLCKGAYMEPPDVAFPQKKDTDFNFIHLTELLLGPQARAAGVQAAVATHDEAMIDAAINYAQQTQLPSTDFEIQMLYGVRRELQASLVERGYRVRIYVPYGTAWYPYLMRRLAERPANVLFFVSNLLRR